MSTYLASISRTRGESIPHGHPFATWYVTLQNNPKSHPEHQLILEKVARTATPPPDPYSLTTFAKKNSLPACPAGFRNILHCIHVFSLLLNYAHYIHVKSRYMYYCIKQFQPLCQCCLFASFERQISVAGAARIYKLDQTGSRYCRLSDSFSSLN